MHDYNEPLYPYPTIKFRSASFNILHLQLRFPRPLTFLQINLPKPPLPKRPPLQTHPSLPMIQLPTRHSPPLSVARLSLSLRDTNLLEQNLTTIQNPFSSRCNITIELGPDC